MIGRLKWIVVLTLMYVALTANAELLNWLLGVFIAMGVVVLIRPNPSHIAWRNLPHAAITGTTFVLTVLWDLIVSGLQVARLVLQPRLDIQQGIIAIPDQTDQEWITTVSAEAITLTPGELVVEIGSDGTLYTHTLDVKVTLNESAQSQADRVHQLEEITA
ncbi:MAG: Na+/H+ antiporter subunit E [Anaerolineae bacterium]|nr:Na+/H+ antiporter subunit E [Anaerolineae bacterium]MCO5198926.1 Na+/H+ antiporter subunit E [Anaerolineae bacterium]